MLADNQDLHQTKAHGFAKGQSISLFTIILLGMLAPTAAHAQIYKWDGPEGSRVQSGNLVPDPGAATLVAEPFADLSFRDLTEAYLINANLFSANLNYSTLTLADMTGANLISANLSGATFNNATFSGAAVFTNAQIASANFSLGTSRGLDRVMIESTASYKLKDLIGVGIGANDMSGWDFSNQNLAAANLSTGTYSVFNDIGLGTYTNSTNFTRTNLASVFATGSNFSNRNLGAPTFSGAVFDQANAASVNFSNGTLNGAVFTDANLSYATLSGASFGTYTVASGTNTIIVPGAPVTNAVDFTNATVNFANLSSTVSGTLSDKGFRKEQLYDTISYKNNDLRGINLSSNDLTVGGSVSQSGTVLTAGGGTWDFSGQNLTGANFSNSTLAINATNLAIQSTATFVTRRTANVNANFTGANLASANFSGATLGGTTNFAKFENATVTFANFSSTTAKGFRKTQLYETASYQSLDLRGINLSSNNLTASGSTNGGWDFSNRNLASANFSSATLSVPSIGTANFAGATISFANFSSTTSRGFTKAMLGATASATNFDLRGINLSSNDFSVGAWDFTNQNLASANFSSATLSFPNIGTANLSGATIAFANFSGTVAKGFGTAQLNSTASYINQDLRGINLSSNVMPGPTWNFSGQNLTGASFTSATLATTNFANATLTQASLNTANLSGALFNGATLRSANFGGSTLSNSNFAGADLTNANFNGTTLATAAGSAMLTNAIIKGATFSFATSRGLTFNMFQETESYQISHDLRGINLSNNNLTGWTLSDNAHKMDLTNASFASTNLTSASLVDATIAFANFSSTTVLGFSEVQLADTLSYVNHDLRGVNLSSNNLRNWDFTNQNLASANFSVASLSTGGLSDLTIFAGANVTTANFSNTTGRGFVREQLYETQSYIDKDLSGINLSFNNLSPTGTNTSWDFSQQKLVGASFANSILAHGGETVNFAGANINNADFSSTTAYGFSEAQFVSTQSYIDKDLGSLGMASNDLRGWNLSDQNLVKANFSNALLGSTTLLTATNFTNAKIAGANFAHTTPYGFTRDQLYSTSTYADHALGSINLSQNDLGSNTIEFTGWDFSQQLMRKANFSLSRLTQANFNDTLLHDVNFTNAGLILTTFERSDIRGASGFTGAMLNTTNAILPDGTIQGLDLTSPVPSIDRHLTIRDYNGSSNIPIHVTKNFTLDSTSSLKVLLADGKWGSTVSFDAGIPVTLGGVLDLGFDDDADLSDIFNYPAHPGFPAHVRPIRLFAWNTTPGTTFTSIVKDPLYSWDTSDLYVGGTILVNGLYGDLDYNGRVDITDLLALATHYGQTTSNWWDGDLNGSGIVNIDDLRLLAANWGYGITTGAAAPASLAPVLASLGLPAVSVPEPMLGGPLAMLGAGALLRRSRRKSNRVTAQV